MAHARAQDELQKRYEEGSQSLEDPEVEHMIRQADEMMGKPARMLIAQAGLDHSTTTNFSLLDHGCGTGLIASCLQEVIQPSVLSQSSILCADINARFVNILLQRARRDHWINVEAGVLDAQDSGLPKHSFSHVTINFAMHIIPDPAVVLRDTIRILRPGGLVAFSVPHANNGHSGGWVPDLRSALKSLPFQTLFPDPMPVALHGKPEWVEPKGIKAELVGHGFVDVTVETVDLIHPVANAEGFLASFGMMIKWVINTYWTAEQKEQYGDDFNKILVEHLQIKHGGKGWDLKSTAILVTARTPQ
ncbi:s-adenosyl-L-methionine-dependent methyltransferase [Fusarium pseudoanthophilum]|uniref:S-adenosyl-L-methionine-dependent methyltransferase n=1 Tax=Fusarium pseudoanthophilum TaxID=48495 RepID=A0A8H5LG19_9HYPO|nr:s-adenosyl-L-methionine-dependent methyltransferase [Fusarium pseudoanthophilum]